MIHIGASKASKPAILAEFMAERSLAKCKIVGPEKFWFESPHESVDWPAIIKYKIFYRMLQEIDSDTVLVVNECLRTTTRSDLTYNCIRHFASQTNHVLVFQWLPMLESIDDLMILVDFATRSRWKGVGWRRAGVHGGIFSPLSVDRSPQFIPKLIDPPSSLIMKYVAARDSMFSDRSGDPHAIPRNLHLLGGRLRASLLSEGELAVCRNSRLGIAGSVVYGGEDGIHRTVIDFPHSFRDMADFLAIGEQAEVPCIVTELNVDRWYLDRYQSWAGEISRANAEILDRIGR